MQSSGSALIKKVILTILLFLFSMLVAQMLIVVFSCPEYKGTCNNGCWLGECSEWECTKAEFVGQCVGWSGFLLLPLSLILSVPTSFYCGSLLRCLPIIEKVELFKRSGIKFTLSVVISVPIFFTLYFLSLLLHSLLLPRVLKIFF